MYALDLAMELEQKNDGQLQIEGFKEGEVSASESLVSDVDDFTATGGLQQVASAGGLEVDEGTNPLQVAAIPAAAVNHVEGENPIEKSWNDSMKSPWVIDKGEL